MVVTDFRFPIDGAAKHLHDKNRVDIDNIVGSKFVDEEEYLTLDYSRMVAILWGQVKELKARLVAIGG